MKKILVPLLFIFSSIFIHASEKYIVFILKGNVTATINGKDQMIKQGDILEEAVIINVRKGSYLTLKSSDKKRHTLTINNPFNGTIKQLKRLKGTRQKRSTSFMLYTKNKTSSDFVDSTHRTMSAGGYNSRDLFISEEECKVLDELHDMFLEADIIDK